MTYTTLKPEPGPTPVGAYSPGRRIGPFVQISGQVSHTSAPDDIEAQTAEVLQQIYALLATEGLGWDDVLMLRVYLANDRYWEAMDATFRRVLREPYPPRTTVSGELGAGTLVEIDALAVMS